MTEAAKTEAAKTETVKTKPVTTEAVKTEAAKTESAKTVAVNADKAETETNNAEKLNSVKEFTFGPAVHAPHPKTIEEYVPVFADQIKRYNKVAYKFWPDQGVVKMSFVMDDRDNNQLWLVKPDGASGRITEEEAVELGVRRLPPEVAADGYFNFYFKGGATLAELEASDEPFPEGGMYFTVDEESLNNQSRWGNYPHRGLFDMFTMVVHESFHLDQASKQNPNWMHSTAEDGMRDKHHYLENTEARLKRHQILVQLMDAVSQSGDIQSVLDVLATFEDYKKQFPKDYENSTFWDRTEGTAQYIEVVSNLYIYYSDQIKNMDDLYRAYAQLGTEKAIYAKSTGLVEEAYDVGCFTGLLLDLLGIEWKEQLMGDNGTSPLIILAQHFQDMELPDPKQMPQEEIDVAMKNIENKKDRIRGLVEESLQQLEDTLETSPDEDRELIENMIQDAKEKLELLKQ
jgi:hypothetical protein